MKAWRWFGPNDTVTIHDLKQMEIETVVTSLYDVPAGQCWSYEQIRALKQYIERAGLNWQVVESLPVAEGIKQHTADYDRLVHHYIQSLRNLAKNGITTVCYNFMPAIDWLRTDLDDTLPSGGVIMNFDYIKFIAFDLFILRRPDAENDYTEDQIHKADKLYTLLSVKEREELAYNIIVKTQTFIHGQHDPSDYKKAFLATLENYRTIDKKTFRNNLATFLRDITTETRDWGIRVAIHPDDPPFSVLGLPRIVSTFEDLHWIFQTIPNEANGLTFCSGSLSASKANDVKKILKTFAHRIYFAHLRNNKVSENGDFHETGHLDGDVDLSELIYLLLTEQAKRKQSDPANDRIPVRPDHGIKMLDDFNRDSPPGYPLIGRFKGLTEITGVETGILYMLKNKPDHL